MGTPTARRRDNVALILFIAAVLATAALLFIGVYRAAEEDVAPGLCEKLCADFLDHKITAEQFVQQVKPPWRPEALRRRGTWVKATLPLSATVTLHGRDDHSGTEIVGFVVYDKRDSRRTIITSAFAAVTDKNGLFDLSMLQLDAWEPTKSTGSSGGLLWNTCEATPPVWPPAANLLIRHPGFDSRFLKVPCSNPWVRWAMMQSGDTDKAHMGALELLPAGAFADCYETFGYRNEQKPGFYSYGHYWFAGPSCEPSRVRAHLAKHPECPVADDALYGWLAATVGRRQYDPTGVTDAKGLLRTQLKAGRDNTGLLISFQPGVSPDGSWEKGIEELERRHSRH